MSDADEDRESPSPRPSGRPQSNRNGRSGRSSNPRTLAREAAVQVLYEVDTTSHLPGSVLEARQRALRLDAAALGFLRWLVAGVVSNRSDLDQLIQRYAPEWPLDQIAVIDRNILRLALFELVSPDADTPSKVTINEAVELAKRFGSDSSPRFINGVLATALRELTQA